MGCPGEDETGRSRALAQYGPDATRGLQRFEASAVTSPNAIITFDENSRVTAWNNGAADMFGRAEGEALGKPVEVLVSEADRMQVRACIASVLAGGVPGYQGIELYALRSTGEAFPVEIHWSRWQEGEELHFGAIMRDMTEKRRERDALYRLANYDALTGLPNRNLLARRITEALSTGTSLALIATGLDGFSDINNTLGHTVGEGVLRLAGERIRDAVPSDGIVARIGEDQFATLLPGESDPLRVSEIANRINVALTRSIVADGHEVSIAGSGGMALTPEHGRSVDDIIASASLALFQARNEGPGGTFMYVPALKAAAVARRMHDAELHRAFERDEFRLVYQPQVRLPGGELASAEALLRWRHPKRGVLAPATFLTALESGVLAEPVGCWIVEAACAQAAEWRKIEPGFHIGVNLFAAQFRDGRLPQVILEALGRHGLTSDALDLEITENIVLDRQQAVVRQLFELREAGFRLAFDDFGTGYASLNLLRSFPITHIKIHRNFTSAMHNSPKDQAIVVSLMELARRLGLEVVAEGIQNHDDCAFLASHGCDRGQGFYFGKPVPPELFAEQFFARGAALRA